MRTSSISFVTLLALVMLPVSAMADGISGRFGLTARVGFLTPADGHFTSGAAVPLGLPTGIETDTGLAFGGGVIYGIDENQTAELSVMHSKYSANYLGTKIIEATTTDISLGFQYRFEPDHKMVPYIGYGADILVNDAEAAGAFSASGRLKANNSIGLHLSIGFDYFLVDNIALNAEFKGLIASKADITDAETNTKGANLNPSSFAGLFGLRMFFD